MSVYSNNQENAFNEAKNLLSQKSADELTRLMSNEDELNRFINNLSEVKTKKVTFESFFEINRFISFRFNKWN